MWDRLEQREISGHALQPGPAERPRPDQPACADLIPQIKHIVVLMMENHSYDNYLGTLPGRGDGLPTGPDGVPNASNVLPNGQRVAAHHLTSTVQFPGNPTQTWNASHLSYADGSCGGFATGCGKPCRRRPGRADGLLDVSRTAVLPRARERLPGGGPLVLLVPGPDLPEPAVPDRGHRPRPGRRPAVGPGGLPGRRDDLRRADQPRHLVGELSQREAGLAGVQAAARACAAWSRCGGWRNRPVAARGDQRRPRQQVVHRRPVPAWVRPVRQSPADHPAVLRRRGGRDAAVGVHRGPGLRRLLGGEPAGHRVGRVVLLRGRQRGDERAGLGVDAAAVDLRRARRLLRSRAAARRGRAGRRPRAELAALEPVGAAPAVGCCRRSRSRRSRTPTTAR